jgi:hypothetical protein
VIDTLAEVKTSPGCVLLPLMTTVVLPAGGTVLRVQITSV